MCVFSYSNNFIFYHIPKCAGTSLYQVLYDVINFEKYIPNTHIDYKKSKQLFESNQKKEWFENTKKFTIFRNPIQRTMSLFKYIKSNPSHHLNKEISNYNLYDFCKYIKNNKLEGITSCYDHIKNEEDKINHIKIFKLENLQSNIEEISELISKKIKQIPHINKSEFDCGIDLRTEEIIRGLFSKDFLFYD